MTKLPDPSFTYLDVWAHTTSERLDERGNHEEFLAQVKALEDQYQGQELLDELRKLVYQRKQVIDGFWNS